MELENITIDQMEDGQEEDRNYELIVGKINEMQKEVLRLEELVEEMKKKVNFTKG